MSVPNIYRFPWELPIETLNASLDRKQGMLEGTYSDNIRTQVYSGGSWVIDYAFKDIEIARSVRVQSWMQKTAGLINRYKMPDPSKLAPRGALPANGFSELVAHSLFDAGSTGWTFGVGDARTRVTSLNKAQIVTDGVHANYVDQSVAVVANTAYIARAFVELAGVASVTLGVGTAAGGQTVAASAAQAQDGYIALPFNSGANVNVHVNVLLPIGAAGQAALTGYISIHRAITVNGAAQVGNVLAVNGLPNNINGLLLAGDLIEIAGNVYECAEDVDSSATGTANIVIQPSLRSSPANGASIITQVPMFVAMWGSTKSPRWNTNAGNFRGYTLSAWEDTLNAA